MQGISNLRDTKPGIHISIELANLVFFDIETTSLRPDRRAKITEIAILNRNDREYYWASTQCSGTSCFHEQLPNILQYLEKGVVVGHNLFFDFWFLSHESDKLGVEGPCVQFIDTLTLARKLLPKRSSYKLGKLLECFHIKVNGKLHTAVTDAEATRALFWKLVQKGGISTMGEAGMKKLNWSSF